MRAAIMLACVAMLLTGNASGEDKPGTENVDLIVTWCEFVTKDAKFVKKLKSLLEEEREGIGSEAVELLHREAKLDREESIAAFVRLNRDFDVTKVQENRTFQIKGSILPAKDAKLRINVMTQELEERKDLVVNGKPAVSNTWNDWAFEMPINNQAVFCFPAGANRLSDGSTQHRIRTVVIRVDKIVR